MKFYKGSSDRYYASINGQVVESIEIHYNFYDRSNYYTVRPVGKEAKQFNYLKDAKAYIKAQYGEE